MKFIGSRILWLPLLVAGLVGPGCGSQSPSPSNVVELFVYERIKVTQAYQADVMRWCSNNNYRFRLIKADSADGMEYAMEKNVEAVPFIIIYGLSGEETKRIDPDHEVYDVLSRELGKN